MKTTVELPDSLASRAKAVAQEQNVTLRELITDGLRAELDRRSLPRQPRPFRFRTVSGQGLQQGVNPGDLIALAYDSPE